MTDTMTAVETRQGQITLDQIRRLVKAWFVAMDDHPPIEVCLGMLAERGLKMHFPNAEIIDAESFRRWYDFVTNRYFDENHFVNSVDAVISGDEAMVDILVGWQASWFEAPDAKAKRCSIDATQRWTVRRTARNEYGLELVTYDATAEPFRFAPGFARP